MRKYFKYPILPLIAGMLFHFAPNTAASPVISTHHTPPLEAGLFSFSEVRYLIAKVSWLPDYQSSFNGSSSSDSDGGLDKKRACSDYGFLSSCSGGMIGIEIKPISSLTCYKSCGCPADFKYDSGNCKVPYYTGGTSCGGKFNQCNLNYEEACKGYAKTCASGWQLATDGRCGYNNDFGTCCNLCNGYNYSTVPDGYLETARCDSCSGAKYQIKENPCDGYTTCKYGAAAGAKSCKSGNTIKFNNCKSCANACTLTACPAGAVCSYEDCSNRYCTTGCKSGYVDMDTYWCGGLLKCWWK